MIRTNIYLEERHTRALDRRAADEGVSRAEIVRRILDRALEGGDDLAADLAAIDASFGSLRDTVMPDRTPSDREDHLSRMWQATA